MDRFSYVEKAEYWALVWGTIVMGFTTGLLMWIYIDYIGIFSKLEWDIARTIHYYEAWLAFLAIVVWHFYFVIFNPDIYPMSLAWFKGTITEEEMAEEHPLELKRIKEKENIDSGSEELIFTIYEYLPKVHTEVYFTNHNYCLLCILFIIRPDK